MNENLVEYAVRDLFKGKSVKAAAARAASNFSGTHNMFLGGDVGHVDPKALEEAVWDRLVDYVIKAMDKIKPGFEHFALAGTLNHFSQTKFKKMRGELKSRVIEKLTYDPFTKDDGL